MATRLATPAAAVQPASAPRFVFQAQGGHVQVQATDRALGVVELMATMAADPKLRGFVIEQCAFDGEYFSALLRKD